MALGFASGHQLSQLIINPLKMSCMSVINI